MTTATYAPTTISRRQRTSPAVSRNILGIALMVLSVMAAFFAGMGDIAGLTQTIDFGNVIVGGTLFALSIGLFIGAGKIYAKMT